jgi:hypothetical protein
VDQWTPRTVHRAPRQPNDNSQHAGTFDGHHSVQSRAEHDKRMSQNGVEEEPTCRCDRHGSSSRGNITGTNSPMDMILGECLVRPHQVLPAIAGHGGPGTGHRTPDAGHGTRDTARRHYAVACDQCQGREIKRHKETNSVAFSSQENSTDRAAATGRISYSQLLRVEGYRVVSPTCPNGR